MRRLLALASAALLLALAVAGFLWQKDRQAASRRLAAWSAQQEEAAHREKLERLITLHGDAISLPDFAALIEKHSGLPVELDEPSIAAVNGGSFGATLWFPLPQGTLTLHSVLRVVLPRHDLWADLLDGRLVITSGDNSRDMSHLTTTVYPLPLTTPGMDEAAWRDVVEGNLQLPDRFASPNLHVEAVPGALVVVHNVDGHRRIRQIIQAISKLGEFTPPHAQTILPPPLPGTMEKQILAALDAPAAIEAIETPLQDIVVRLAERHSIPLLLNVNELAKAAIRPDTPVTKMLSGLPLRSTLRLLLADLELTFTLRNEALIITTIEDAQSEEITVAYPVHDLLDRGGPLDWDPFVDMLTTSISPHVWDSSGPGPQLGYGDGWLIVSQIWDYHQELSAFLSRLRELLSSPPSARVVSVVANPKADQKIRAALERPLAFNLQVSELKALPWMLQQELGIPVVLAAKKLEEAGVSPGTPLTFLFPPAPAKDQLRGLLKIFDLAYVIRDDVLQITTPEDAESQLLLRLYDVRALMSDTTDQKFSDKIVQSVNPPQWDRLGGPATVQAYRGILVVCNTEQGHADLEKWLTAYRAQHPPESSAP